MYSIDIQINRLCCEILKSFTYVLPKNNKKRCNLFSYTVYANRFCDSDRIQTCNLLIRSQVLYSVKLRSHSLIASANVGHFSGLCKFFRINFKGTGKTQARESDTFRRALLRPEKKGGSRAGIGRRNLRAAVWRGAGIQTGAADGETIAIPGTPIWRECRHPVFGQGRAAAGREG